MANAIAIATAKSACPRGRKCVSALGPGAALGAAPFAANWLRSSDAAMLFRGRKGRKKYDLDTILLLLQNKHEKVAKQLNVARTLGAGFVSQVDVPVSQTERGRESDAQFSGSRKFQNPLFAQTPFSDMPTTVRIYLPTSMEK